MNEEEFYDAIETALDRQDEEEATMVGVLIICFTYFPSNLLLQ